MVTTYKLHFDIVAENISRGRRMKIQTWNIRHGGKKSEINNIIQSIKNHNADTIIITEYRENQNGHRLKSDLKELGWLFQYSSKPLENQNGILVLSKMEMKLNTKNSCLPKATHRWIDVSFKDINLSLLGVHIPGFKEKWDKQDFWRKLLEFASENIRNNYIILGDFNTGLSIDCEGRMFKYSEYMNDMIEMEWIDSWRFLHGEKREYTWYSNANNGFRIDYAFFSPPTMRYLKDAYYSHIERICKYSDHSALLINLKDEPVY